MHEKSCKFRPYICPYIECDHKLAAEAVVEHVSTAHRDECRRSDGPEITASMILIGLYFGKFSKFAHTCVMVLQNDLQLEPHFGTFFGIHPVPVFL